jgi:purine-binding chemotaxis protein CheW
MAKRASPTSAAPGETRSGDVASAGASPIAVDGPEQHLVVVRLADDLLGLRMEDIAEIIRVPPLVHMPLAPRSLLGLISLRGSVLPVVSLRRLLGLPDAAQDEAARIVVVDRGAPVGFVVDRIDTLVAVAAERVEHASAGAGRIDPHLLHGVVRGAEGENSVKILVPERLLRDEFERFGRSDARSGASLVSLSSMAAARSAEPVRQTSLVSFELGVQEYALAVECVREIVPMPEHVGDVAGRETAVRGVVTLRDRLLPLVSLRALLGMPDDRQGPRRGKVLVLSAGDGSVGLVVDRTREILRVDPNLIEAAPALLTRGPGEADIESICRLDGGRRLVAVLSPDRLFRSDVMRLIMSDAGTVDTQASDTGNGSAMNDEQFIVFRLGGQDYGLPIASVVEITRPPDNITRLPKAPKFIDGVINLRGNVVPVIDLCQRLGLEPQQSAGLQRILVLSVGGGPTGFLVDTVSEVMRIAPKAIFDAPDMSVGKMRLIGRVANLDALGRMILLIDPAQLLDRIEADVLAKFDRLPSTQALFPA